jgi:DNA-binding MarR family transcriptional regulator
MQLDRSTTTAWTALVSASRILIEKVEAALKSEGHPPLAWYDALLEIEKAGTDGLRPFEIKERLLLPQYGTSRLLDRLVKAGLLEREACADDARGQVIRITEQGRGVRRAMWPVYARVLSEEFESRLTAKDTAQLGSLLTRFRNSS